MAGHRRAVCPGEAGYDTKSRWRWEQTEFRGWHKVPRFVPIYQKKCPIGLDPKVARLLIRIAAAAFVLLPSTASAEEAPSEASESPPIQWTWTAGFDFSRGHYGLPEKTNLYYIPLVVTADYRRFRANLVIPVLASGGPTRFIEGSAVGDPRVDSGLEAGLGRIQASVSYLFDPLIEHAPFIE